MSSISQIHTEYDESPDIIYYGQVHEGHKVMSELGLNRGIEVTKGEEVIRSLERTP